MLKFTVFLPLLFGSVSCLRWPDHLQDPSRPVEVCAGDNIRLLWNFTLEAGEQVKEMVWTCQTEGQEAEHVVATYLSDNFVPASEFSGRLLHLQGGGVEMSCATKLESGNYSVTVTTEDSHNKQTVYSKRAVVTVLDVPKTYRGYLEVTKEEKLAYDESSGQWHVQLTCGNFSDKGHPHIDVIWRTPEGQELQSSSEDNETFQLLVPNPPSGGNYSSENSQLRSDLAQLTLENNQLWSDLSTNFTELRSFVEDTKSEAESEAALLRSQMGAGNKRISFHGRLQNSESFLIRRLQAFTRDVVNDGGAFNPSTGVFTTPFDGTYYFIGIAGTYSSDKLVSMYLVKDGTKLSRALAQQYSSYETMGSCNAVLHLAAGEQVWLESDGSVTYYYSPSTTFTGFLINADE